MTGLHRTITGFAPGRIQHWIRLVGVLALLSAAVAAKAATFTATLDHDTILLGDTATLALKFDGGEPKSLSGLPAIPGLQFLNAGNPSVSRMNVNGRRSLVLGVMVQPTQVGEFTIPPISADVDGESLLSQPVRFRVVGKDAPAPGSEEDQQKLALLRLVLPKQEAIVGETIIVELQLLLNEVVQNNGNPEIPSLQFEGCTVGNPVAGNARRTVIHTTYFKLIPIYLPVTIIRSGFINMGPIEGSIVVELPSRNREPDLFERYGLPGMFSRGVQQRVAISAPAQTLTALPLPEAGKPATFTGAVGQFKMAVSAAPTNVAVGDPITLRVQISGKGSLDSFTLPDQPAWKEFKAYPPTVKTELTGDLGIEGKKFFEQVVVPQNTEIQELPPLEFAYFDPEQRGYRTLREPALPLVVRPSGSTPSPTLAVTGSPAAEAPAAQDIVHIKPRLGRVVSSSAPWIERPWFLALQSVPVLALLGAVFWRRRTDALANNPRLRRQQQVEHLVRQGLGQLRQLAAQRQSDEFFATVFRLMQEQIGERLDLPASAITEAIIDDKLRGRGLTEGAAESLHQLFQQCNQARYAPVESKHELEAVIPKLESALRELQEVKP